LVRTGTTSKRFATNPKPNLIYGLPQKSKGLIGSCGKDE
jgi:hypothetical protein